MSHVALYSKPPIPDEAIWEVFARFRVHGIGTKPILALWTAKILISVGKYLSSLKNCMNLPGQYLGNNFFL